MCSNWTQTQNKIQQFPHHIIAVVSWELSLWKKILKYQNQNHWKLGKISELSDEATFRDLQGNFQVTSVQW